MSNSDVLLLIGKLALVIIQAVLLVLGLGFPEGHAISAIAAPRRRPLLAGLLCTVFAQGVIAAFETRRDVEQAKKQHEATREILRPLYTLEEGRGAVRFRITNDPRVKAEALFKTAENYCTLPGSGIYCRKVDGKLVEIGIRFGPDISFPELLPDANPRIEPRNWLSERLGPNATVDITFYDEKLPGDVFSDLDIEDLHTWEKHPKTTSRIGHALGGTEIKIPDNPFGMLIVEATPPGVLLEVWGDLPAPSRGDPAISDVAGGTILVRRLIRPGYDLTHQSVIKTTFLLYFPKAGATLAA